MSDEAGAQRQRKAAIGELIEWCRQRCPSSFVCRTDLIDFKVGPDGDCMVVAKQDIPEEVTLMRVSVELMFSQKNTKKKIRHVLNDVESKMVRFFETNGDFLGSDE